MKDGQIKKAIKIIQESKLEYRVRRAISFSYRLKKQGVSYYSFIVKLIDYCPGTAAMISEELYQIGNFNYDEYNLLRELEREPTFLSKIKKRVSCLETEVELTAFYMACCNNKTLYSFFAEKRTSPFYLYEIISKTLEYIEASPLESIYFAKLLNASYQYIGNQLTVEIMKNYSKQFLLNSSAPNELIILYKNLLQRNKFDILFLISDIYVNLSPKKMGITTSELMDHATTGEPSGMFKRIVRVEQILRKNTTNLESVNEWWDALSKYSTREYVKGMDKILLAYRQCLLIAANPLDFDNISQTQLPVYSLTSNKMSKRNFQYYQNTCIKYLARVEDLAYMAILKENPACLLPFRKYLRDWNVFEYGKKRIIYSLSTSNFKYINALTILRRTGMTRKEIVDTYMNSSLKAHISLQLLLYSLFSSNAEQNTFLVSKLFEAYPIHCSQYTKHQGVLSADFRAFVLKCTDNTMKLLDEIYEKIRSCDCDPNYFMRSSLEFRIIEYNSSDFSVQVILKTPKEEIEKRIQNYLEYNS